MKWILWVSLTAWLLAANTGFAQHVDLDSILGKSGTSESRLWPAFGGAFVANAATFGAGSVLTMVLTEEKVVCKSTYCINHLLIGFGSSIAVGVPMTAIGASIGGAGMDGDWKYGSTLLGSAIGLHLGMALGFGLATIVGGETENGVAIAMAAVIPMTLGMSLGAAIGYENARDAPEEDGVALAPTFSISDDGGSLGLVGIF